MGGKSRKRIGTPTSHAFDDIASEFAASFVSGLLARSSSLQKPIEKVLIYRQQTAITPVEAWVFTRKLRSYDRSKSALQIDCCHSSLSIPTTIDDRDPVLETLVARFAGVAQVVDSLEWGDSGLPTQAYYNELRRALHKSLDQLRSAGLALAANAEIEVIDDDGSLLFAVSKQNDSALQKATASLPPGLRKDLACCFYKSKERQAWFIQLAVPTKGTPPAEAGLTKAVTRFVEGDEDVRFSAAEDLVAFGEKALPALLGFLTHQSLLIRRDAAETLGEIGSVAACVPLVALLLGDIDEEVRSEAATALGRIGDSSHQNALTQALHDASEFVQEEAKAALEKLGHTPS